MCLRIALKEDNPLWYKVLEYSDKYIGKSSDSGFWRVSDV
jgi:hypothetical protein